MVYVRPSTLKNQERLSSERARRYPQYLPWLVLCFACAAYGFVFALVAPNFLLPVVVPLLALAACIFWTFPKVDNPPTKLLEVLYFTFVVVSIVWPNYLALALPGLPWITMVRLFGLPLGLTLVFCITTSPTFRQTLGAILASSSILWKVFVGFIALQAISIGLSADTLYSINMFVEAQVCWTAVFLTSCYIFVTPGRATFWAVVIWSTAMLVSVIGLVEHSAGHILWANHIPAFLKIDDQFVRYILSPEVREYTGRYRAKSTFNNPLLFAEFVAFALPFVLHFIRSDRQIVVRLAAVASIPVLIAAEFSTDGRLGMIGCLMALFMYAFFWSVERWRYEPGNLFAPAIALLYPLIATSALFSHRIRAITWGGDATQQASTFDRIDQLNMAIPKIKSAPWGYGVGMGATTLDYHSPGSGILTIDSYYLVILLEYGFVGFFLFFAMPLIAIRTAGKHYIFSKQRDWESRLLLPLMIALLAFCVVKSVLSLINNHSLVFMMMGMVVALKFRDDLANILPTPKM